MSVKKISSSKLKQLNGTTKDLINMGRWFLDEVSCKKLPNVKYALSAGGDTYILDKEGSVISKNLDYKDNIVYEGRVLFDDMPYIEPVDNLNQIWA